MRHLTLFSIHNPPPILFTGFIKCVYVRVFGGGGKGASASTAICASLKTTKKSKLHTVIKGSALFVF
jgi:hypothetical protein